MGEVINRCAGKIHQFAWKDGAQHPAAVRSGFIVLGSLGGARTLPPAHQTEKESGRSFWLLPLLE
jgi:hypothetical protein